MKQDITLPDTFTVFAFHHSFFFSQNMHACLPRLVGGPWPPQQQTGPSPNEETINHVWGAVWVSVLWTTTTLSRLSPLKAGQQASTPRRHALALSDILTDVDGWPKKEKKHIFSDTLKCTWRSMKSQWARAYGDFAMHIHTCTHTCTDSYIGFVIPST